MQTWIGHDMFAANFTPPSGGMMLLGARVYVTGDLAPFKIRLFDSDEHMYTYIRPQGTFDLYFGWQWTVTPTVTGWVDVNVSNAEIYVWSSFYVAVEFTVDMKPGVGLDTTNSQDRGWFIGNHTTWIPYSSFAKSHNLPDGNVMIRALVAPIQPLTAPAPNPTTISTRDETSTQQSFPFTVSENLRCWHDDGGTLHHGTTVQMS
jgi:hypothetical protein